MSAKSYQFATTVKDAGGRTRRFIISTPAGDRDGDVVEISAWQLDAFRKNPVVLFAHDYKSLPIGRCTKIWIEGNNLVAEVLFADFEMADTVLRLIDGGFLSATSVGFRVLESQPRAGGGRTFTSAELLEFSIVPVPANPQALVVARSKGIALDGLRLWAQSVMAGTSRAAKACATNLTAALDRTDVIEEHTSKAGRAISAANMTHVDALAGHLAGLDTLHGEQRALAREASATCRAAREHIDALRPDAEVLDIDDDDTVECSDDDIDLKDVAALLPGIVNALLKDHATALVKREVITRTRGRIDLDGGSIEARDVAQVLPAVIRATLRESLNSIVADAVTRTLRRAQGRLD